MSGALAPLIAFAESHCPPPQSVTEDLRDASDFALNITKHLESSAWVDANSMMSLAHVSKLFGFCFLLAGIHPKTAQQMYDKDISFSPTDSLTRFALKLRDDKSLVSKSTTSSTAASVAPVATSGKHKSRRDSSTTRSASRHSSHRSASRHSHCSHSPHSSTYCYFCKHKGHSIDKCFRRQRDHPSQSHKHRFCSHHGSCGHTTSECRALANRSHSPARSDSSKTSA